MRRILVYSIMALILACPSAGFAQPETNTPADKEAARKMARQLAENTSREIAERVREKALFKADVMPQLERLQEKIGGRRWSHQAPVDEVTEQLWLLRGDKDLQREWINKILTSEGKKTLDKNIRDLAQIVDDTRKIAQLLEIKHDAERRAEAGKRGSSDARPSTPVLTRKLEAEKRRETALAEAGAVSRLLAQAEVSLYDAERYIDSLRALQNDPEALKMAGSLINNRKFSREATMSLLDLLAKDPQKAKVELANQEELRNMAARYTFIMHTEGYTDLIKMPVATVYPTGAEALAKTKTMPLATSSFKRTGGLLETRRLEKLMLIDKEHGLPLRSENPGENEHIAFLYPGERLYVVGGVTQNPIYKNTPLELLTPFGPHIKEYSDTERYMFSTGSRSAMHMRQSYLIAAACGPEELAAHLASISVVLAEREKSLYGPFEDFLMQPEEDRAGRRAGRHDHAETTPDTPGKALRFIELWDADFFFALAPVADKEGLARLMGPIRGIWVQNRAASATPWAELRYKPDGKTENGVLGESPILELGKDALENIIATKKDFLIYAWAVFAIRDQERNGENPEYTKLLPEALQRTAAEFDALAKVGFVSPWDMGTATYCLRMAEKDAALTVKLQKSRDDTSLSSAKRIRAMRALIDTELRGKTRR
ncbi:MAG: hypothetical protein DELT_00952 [Desulfovibrio sp.]